MIEVANRASTILYWFIKTFPEGTYLLPANVCAVVPLTFIKAKVGFRFVDINPETLCMDEKSTIRLVEKEKNKFAGIVFVRTYGCSYKTCDFFSQLKSINKKIKIIDDKCLCYPDFESISESTDMELFSTGDRKTLSLGYGGYAKIRDNITLKRPNEAFNPDSYSLLERKYKDSLNEGKILETYSHDWLDTQSPIYNKTDYVDRIKENLINIRNHKLTINSIYKNKLKNVIALEDNYQNWRYNILTDKKDQILKTILSEGLFASSHYKPSNLLFNHVRYPNAEKLFNSVINLFNDFYFSKEQATKVSEIIRNSL